MDAEERAALHYSLHERREVIATQWQRAIARTGFAPTDPADVTDTLIRLVEEVGDILTAEGFAPERAQDLGTALVALGYTAPETLRGTAQTLARELPSGLSSAQLPALQPRLTALLREVSVGFCAAMREAILAEQEIQRRTELAERRRIEARLRAVTGHLPVALFALDRAGIVVMADGRELAALGLTAAAVEGRPIADLFAGVSTLVKDAGRALAGEDTTTVAAVGEVVIEVRHTPLRDEAGAIVGAIGVALDITARRHAEEQLQTVLHHAPIALFVLDRVGTITLSEGRGLAVLRRRRGETTVGRSIFDVYHEEPMILRDLHRALAGEAFVTRTVVGDVTYETHYVPLRDADGASAGVLGVGTDITARARAEAALRRREARLSATEEALLPLLARADLVTYRQVGASLGFGPERVRDLVKSIAAKLGVESARAVVVAAIRDCELL